MRAHALLEACAGEGAIVVDATMGNGHDTEFLAKLVGPSGHVYAFDIQEAAVTATGRRLAEAELADRCTLILDGHQNIPAHVREPIDGAMFNLGWLPGSPHETFTRFETTRAGIEGALSLLKKGGLVTVCVYPGHEEGQREKDLLVDWISSLDDRKYDAAFFGYLNLKKKPPCLLMITKKT